MQFYTYARGQVFNKDYSEKSANKRYNEGVIFELDKFRKAHRGAGNHVVADPKELYDLQLRIENMTM